MTDVWSIDKSIFTSPTTIGGHVAKLKNPSFLIDGEVIV